MSPSPCFTEKRRRGRGVRKDKEGKEREKEGKKERRLLSNFHVQNAIYIFTNPVMCCAYNPTDDEIEVQRS